MKSKIAGIMYLFSLLLGCDQISDRNEDAFNASSEMADFAIASELRMMTEFQEISNHKYYELLKDRGKGDTEILDSIHLMTISMLAEIDTLTSQFAAFQSEERNSSLSNHEAWKHRISSYWLKSSGSDTLRTEPIYMESRAGRLRRILHDHVNYVGTKLDEITNGKEIQLNPYYPIDGNLNPMQIPFKDKTWEELHFQSASEIEIECYLIFVKLRILILEMEFLIHWQQG